MSDRADVCSSGSPAVRFPLARHRAPTDRRQINAACALTAPQEFKLMIVFFLLRVTKGQKQRPAPLPRVRDDVLPVLFCTSPVSASLNRLPGSLRIDFMNLLITLKALCGLAPDYVFRSFNPL